MERLARTSSARPLLSPKLLQNFMQAPLFFFSGVQLHSLRARVNFGLQMGRNVCAQTRLGIKNSYAKVSALLTKYSILTTTNIEYKSVVATQALTASYAACSPYPPYE
jgi:hypothetical protein